MHLRSCKTPIEEAPKTVQQHKKTLMPSAKAVSELQRPKEENKAIKKPKESFAEIIRSAKNVKGFGGAKIEIVEKQSKSQGPINVIGKPSFKASYD